MEIDGAVTASEEEGNTTMYAGAIVCCDNVEDNLNHEAEEEPNGETDNSRKKEDKVDEDEEIIGRYEREIEDDVADFVDEQFRGRHTIPESSDEEEEDEFVVQKRRMKSKSDKLALGASFCTGSQFKEAVLDYALTKARNVKQSRWDTDKLEYRCGSGKCKWRIYCAYDKPTKKWRINTKYPSHNCHRNGRCAMLKSPVIANLFMDKLRIQPNCMPEEIQSLIKENWRLVSTRDQCQRGRLLALKLLEKEYREQFTHLRGYAEEIVFTNPGSTALVETYTNAAGEDVFDKFYVCIASLRDSWAGTCRPIIGLDGTFLKAAVKGVLLTAVGHDGNNQIYPIAWAVVQRENGPNWLWFVQQLKDDLNLKTGAGVVIISDRSKGLIHAVKETLPSAEHRMCVKHIVENLKNNGHKDKDLLKPMVWNLAWSYTKEAFQENVRKLQDYDWSLYEAVMKEKPETWSLAFYKLGSCCEDVDNNSTESFNATITKARSKALVPMLETIRRQAMARNAKRRMKSLKLEGLCTKYVKETLAELRKHADICKTTPATHGVYEAFLFGNSYVVNLKNKTCSCGKYEISGIPCEHAYGAIINAGLDVENYVSLWFSKDMWQLTYEKNMEPVRGPRFWMKRGYRLVVEPPEPDLPGRKKNSKKIKKRIKGKHESPKKKRKEVQRLPRTGRIIHCWNCGEEGHNYLGCKIHPKKKPKKMIDAEKSEAKGSSQGADLISLTQPSQEPSQVAD